MAALDRDATAIAHLIEDGSLPWAFRVGQSPEAREIRVLAHSVSDFQNGQTKRSRTMDFQEVLSLIFPMVKMLPGVVAKLKATTIARRFNLKAESVIKLMDLGILHAAPGTVRSCGPAGSPEILFSSVVEFLQRRRIV